jgi:porphobilinogen synthase
MGYGGSGHFPEVRLHRLRQSSAMRRLVQETHLHPHQFIMPLFVAENLTKAKQVASLPGQKIYPLKGLKSIVSEIKQASIQAILVFVLPEQKVSQANDVLRQQRFTAEVIQEIKALYPECVLMVDACFCSAMDHGHCGVLQENGRIDNDATLELLGQSAVIMAEAGADVIAPSGMIDGMVGQIRCALDDRNLIDTGIMSYAVKYASQFYGPFRDASSGAPKQGGREHYQMNPPQAQEALREAAQDVAQGTDFLMVKPAHTYLDVIYRVKQQHPQVPLVAYHVSGEYAMLHAAKQQGLINDLALATFEVLHAIVRAGADQLISYQACQVALWIKDAY